MFIRVFDHPRMENFSRRREELAQHNTLEENGARVGEKNASNRTTQKEIGSPH